MTRYIVKIQTGKRKNLARSHSIPLPTKERVSNFVKRNPIGNYKTEIEVEDLLTKKSIKGQKIKFHRTNW